MNDPQGPSYRVGETLRCFVPPLPGAPGKPGIVQVKILAVDGAVGSNAFRCLVKCDDTPIPILANAVIASKLMQKMFRNDAPLQATMVKLLMHNTTENQAARSLGFANYVAK